MELIPWFARVIDYQVVLPTPFEMKKIDQKKAPRRVTLKYMLQYRTMFRLK